MVLQESVFHVIQSAMSRFKNGKIEYIDFDEYYNRFNTELNGMAES